jgi:hypothetical protein
MTTLIYGVAVLAVLWWVSRFFAGANPAVMAKRMKQVGGVSALVVAVIFAARGRFDMAFFLGGLAAWLLGWSGIGLPGWKSRTAKSPGSVSRVRSAVIEMELDHDTGEMNGAVLAGAFTGRSLNELDEAALRQIYEECRRGDPDGVRLLEAYLDRRFAGWREHAQRDDDAGPRGGAQPGPMTEQEAYQILGLQPGASAEEVRRAHRTLMLKLHPDHGGTTYLAARINEAKDVLLNRHR